MTADQITFEPAPKEGRDMVYMIVPGRPRSVMRSRYMNDGVKSALCPKCTEFNTFICHHA